MKPLIHILLLLLITWTARAQTLLQQQSFETSETVNYTASTVATLSSGNTYFYNATLPVPGYLNTTSDQTSTVVNIQGVAAGSTGTHFWASESVRRDANNTPRGNPAANLTLNALNVAGKSNLSVTVALADAAGPATGSTSANPEGTGGNVVPRWEQDDFIRVQYNLDNTGWVTIGQFVGDNANAGLEAGRLRRDANLDGVSNYNIEPNSPILTQTLTDYSFAIPGSGSSLQVRVQIDQDGNSEEFGFDNIRVYGSVAASASPMLAGIESTAIAYAEGSGAVQITNGITISDSDSPTLSGATITISTNYQASEDRLLFTAQNGITTTGFNTTTGVLTLTGSSSLANYRDALRSVQYQNIDANDASTVTRTVSFNVVDNASVGSNTVTRNITVTAALDAASVGLPYVETFESEGEGTRYASNHFFTQNAAQFQRTNTNPIPGGTTFSNIVGSYYWVGVNTAGSIALNPTGTGNGTVTTKQINTAGYINLGFQIRVGASTSTTSGSGPNWKIDDYFQLRYRTAGSSTWTAFGLFRGNNPALTGSGIIRQDSNPNGTGAPSASGTQLTESLQNFTFSLPASLNGQTLEFQMLAVVQDGNNLLAFDQIQVTGTQVVAPTVTTADATNISTSGATLGGNVTSDGGATVNGRGVVYSNSNTNPTVGGANVTTLPNTNGSGTGTFSANVLGLSPGTRYYVAAYATNSIGTSYGSVKTFVTTPNAPVVNTPANQAVLATTTPTYTGTAQNNATITVFVDGSSIGTTTATGSGVWSFNQTTAINQGPHTVFAQATITVNGTTSPTSANSNTNTFTVDTVAPTITNFASTAGASGNNTAISPFPFSVTFSESVTGFSTSGIQVTNGSVTSGPTGNGSGPYTFEVTPATPFMATTVQIPANAVQDQVGLKNAVSSLYTLTYQPPVTAAPVVMSPTNNGTVNTRTPTYSGTAPTSSTVTVYVNGNSVGTTIAANGQFSLMQPTSLPDGVYSVSASAQSSGQRVSANSNVNTFTVDATAPTVSSVGVPANGNYGIGKVLSFTVGFSENVLVSGTPQLGLTIGTTARQAAYVSGSNSSSLVFTYTVQSGDGAPNGISLGALALAGGTIRDAAGNDATLTLNGIPNTTGVLVDAVAPTVVSSNRERPTGPTTNASSVTFFVTFSESVTGITGNSFIVTNPTGAVTGTIDAVATAINGNNKVASVAVVGISGNGTLRLDVKSSGSGITDLAGNPLSGGFTTGETYTIDQTRPSVVITTVPTVSGGFISGFYPVAVTVTFSETVSGFGTDKLSVTNGDVRDFAGSGSTYTFRLFPLAKGQTSISVAANAAQDGAGNGNTAASPVSFFYLPPVTVTGFAASPSPVCATAPVTLTATLGVLTDTYSFTLLGDNQFIIGNSPNAFSQTLTVRGSGTITFSLRVFNGYTYAFANTSITVNPQPTVSLANNGPITCTQPTVTLTASGNGQGQALTYRFSANATQIGGASSNSATVSQAGDYSVTAITSSGCSATALTTVGNSATLATPTLLTTNGQSAVTVDLNASPITLLVGGCSGTASWTGSNGTSGTGSTIVVPTGQPGRFVYRATCQLGTCVSDPASATVTVQGRLTVLHRDVDNYADNNAIQPLIVLQNQGAGTLPLSGLTLRYYLTVEGASALSNLSVNYAQVGNQNVRLRYVPLTPAQTGAAGYVEYSFTPQAGNLAPGGSSGPIQTYFAKGDYGSLNELDDYSYAAVRDQLVGNLRITAYYNGALIAGIEPGTPMPTIRAVRALTESKNGPSATQINTFLEVRNEGNVPINYSDLRVRYYFTSDGSERLQVEVDEGNVQTRLARLPQAINGADTYLELSFTQGGQLAPGASTGTIRYRISKPDGGRFDQTNDYSYQEQPQERSQNSRVVVYAGADRLWGTEPSASARVATSGEPGTQLRVRVIGNPVEGDQLRVDVTGAQGQALRLLVSDVTGRLVTERLVEQAGLVEHQELKVGGTASGVLLLQVSTPTQSQTVRVLKVD